MAGVAWPVDIDLWMSEQALQSSAGRRAGAALAKAAPCDDLSSMTHDRGLDAIVAPHWSRQNRGL